MTSQQFWQLVKNSFSPGMVRRVVTDIYRISTSLTLENSQISENSSTIGPHHVSSSFIYLQKPQLIFFIIHNGLHIGLIQAEIFANSLNFHHLLRSLIQYVLFDSVRNFVVANSLITKSPVIKEWSQ